MIETGKYLENIVEKLMILRREVEVKSALGLLNINKHCENFLKRVLNLTYNFELENLNQGAANYPGLDLGDTGEKIAYQITATRKSDKVDDTLITCLKHEHYKTFDQINIFILTNKQNSYTIKTITEPNFNFDPQKNIFDFDDLIQDIQHIHPDKIKALNDYINYELQYTIASLNGTAEKDEVLKKDLLNKDLVLQKTGMTIYSHWKSKVSLLDEEVSVPTLHKRLNEFVDTAMKKIRFFPTLNPALLTSSNSKEMVFVHEIVSTGIHNMFYGHALAIVPSSLTFESVDYTNNKPMLANLLREMMGLIGQILFMSTLTKQRVNLKIQIKYITNTELVFHSERALVKTGSIFKIYELDNNNFELTETIKDIDTSTLVDLLQKVIHGFIAKKLGPYSFDPFVSSDPFLSIDSEATGHVISLIKQELGIST